MPFKSEAQRRLFHVKEEEGEIAPKVVSEWEHATKNKKTLPMHVKKGAEDALECFGMKREKEAGIGPLLTGAKVLGGKILGSETGRNMLGQGLASFAMSGGDVKSGVVGALGGIPGAKGMAAQTIGGMALNR